MSLIFYHIIGAALVSLPLFAITYRVSREEAGGPIAAVIFIFGLCLIGGITFLSL